MFICFGKKILRDPRRLHAIRRGGVGADLLCDFGMGDKDRAFEWLDKAYDERRADLGWIKADPRMDLLRSDARYKELLLRLGLPE